MGMTIDLAIDIAKHPTDYFLSEREEAIKFGIDTMRKYQKIEQMLYEFKDMTYAPCLMKGHMCAVHEILKEVVENGNDD